MSQPNGRHHADLVLDRDRRIVSISRSLAGLLGYKPAELVGKTTNGLSVRTPATRARFLSLKDKGTTVHATTILKARDGRRIPYAFTAWREGELWMARGEPADDASLEAEDAPLTRDPDPWISPKQAAAYAGVSTSTLARHARSGALAAGGTPGRRRYKRSDLDAFMRHFGGGVAILLAMLAVGLLLGLLLRGRQMRHLARHPARYRHDIDFRGGRL